MLEMEWRKDKLRKDRLGRFVEFFSGESIAFPAKSSGVENVPLKRRIRREFCSMLTENITKYAVVSFAEQSRAAE